jgi:hypothetical protein
MLFGAEESYGGENLFASHKGGCAYLAIIKLELPPVFEDCQELPDMTPVDAIPS